jgi:hypothetical protein
VHYASFVVFAATTVHGLTAGSDARSPALLLAYLAASALVAGLTASRFLASTRRSAATQPKVASTAIGTPLTRRATSQFDPCTRSRARR